MRSDAVISHSLTLQLVAFHIKGAVTDPHTFGYYKSVVAVVFALFK